MSLAVVVYVPEGIIMASDSRQTLEVEARTPEGESYKVETVGSDYLTKTFLLEEQRVGVSHFGDTMLGGVTMASHIKRFASEQVNEGDDVEVIASRLLKYFRGLFPDADAGFHVAGYRKEGRRVVPHVYYCHVGDNVRERTNLEDGEIVYGATWSGATEIIESIINPVVVEEEHGQEKVVREPASISWETMTVQDAIDFAIYAIRTTIDTMRFQAVPKTVGGPIDILLLTPDSEPRWIQKKDYQGERV